MNQTVTHLIEPQPDRFESEYISLRKKEYHLYTDDELRALPFVPEAHVHYSEWQMRQASSKRLIQYFAAKKRPLKILDVGCGNGWMSGMLAGIERSIVTGTDVNTTELKQAREVFNKPNLTFIHGDIRDQSLNLAQQDVVLFAASVQYFPSLTEIVETALSLLSPGGEVHIIDSPFYKNGDEVAARQRTIAHCASLGNPEMAAYYHHHKFDDLKNFDYTIRYNPFAIANRFFRKRNPFYWISITQR